MAPREHVAGLLLSLSKRNFLFLLFAINIILKTANGVDRNNFKTCEQSSFCRRNRAIPSGDTPYSVMPESIQFKSDAVTGHILDNRNNIKLVFEINVLEKATARIRISELNPIRPRYEVKDSLVGEPKRISYKKVSEDSSGFKIQFGGNSVAVIYKPFRTDFYDENGIVLSMNNKGQMNFEHYRVKEEPKPMEPPEVTEAEGEDVKKDGAEEAVKGEGEEQKEAEPEPPKEENKGEEGMWEENFNSHADTKPRGPSSIAMDFSFIGFEHVYGIPEHADSMALKTTGSSDPYRLYNLDVFKYELDNPMALYGSIPYMVAHSSKRTVGIFWNNAAETWVDIKTSKATESVPEMDTHWISESGIIDTFVMLGPKPLDVFSQYAALTGPCTLPPLFSLAYHQSRWNYNDQEDVRGVDAGFDSHDIPFDVLWLDIEHTDGKKYFTWDSGKFPDSVEMQDNLATKGRKMVNIVDPHIKREDGYHIHSDASEKNFYVHNKDRGHYDGWCWPGSSSWIDFTNPQAREWWASKFGLDQYQGTTEHLHIWNDMNEPSVFNGPEITMHKDALHFGDWEHRDVHNIFGMYVHMATADGLIQRSRGTLRPFVLSRAFFAGSQRYGAIWTGDNTADWGHLRISVPMILSLNIAGLPFAGADVGGFFDNPDTELLIRWYQAGAHQPFFRAHAHLDTKRREPWLYDEATRNVIRAAIRRRYAMLPYWYTVFREASVTGNPVMRPLWVEYPEDPTTFGMDDEYLIGRDILVKPVVHASQTSLDIYFPGGKHAIWYDVEDFTAHHGGISTVDTPLNKIPVFQRGGSIVPWKERIRRSSSLMHRDPYTLVIAVNASSQADGEIYVDDGQSFEYKNGKYIFAKFQFTGKSLVKWNLHSDFQTKAWIERIIILGLQKSFDKVTLMAKDHVVNLESYYDSDKRITVIKKPGVNIAVNFSIVFS